MTVPDVGRHRIRWRTREVRRQHQIQGWRSKWQREMCVRSRARWWAGSRFRILTHRCKSKGQEKKLSSCIFFFKSLKTGKQTSGKPETEIVVIMSHGLNAFLFILNSFVFHKTTICLQSSPYLSFIFDSGGKQSNGILFTNALFDCLLAKLFQSVFSIQCCQI